MPAKSAFEKAVGVRLNRESIRAIELSGENPSEWLRQAAWLRIESERAKPETHPLEKQLAALHKSVADIQRDLTKLHLIQVDNKATLEKLQEKQIDFHHLLAKTNEEFSDGLAELAESLMQAFGQQIEILLEAHSKPKPFSLPPPPPRTRL